MECHFSFSKKIGLLVFHALLFVNLFAQSSLLTSSNLPIVVINTGGQAILDDPKITADLGIVYNGTGQRNALTDAFNHYNGKIGIEVRGQSSQMFPMKSYGIELRLADGSSNNQSLLGMPSESDWVLYAPYADRTCVRNTLAQHLFGAMGHYTTKSIFVDLYINNNYAGLYELREKIDLEKQGLDTITGIFKFDKTTGKKRRNRLH